MALISDFTDGSARSSRDERRRQQDKKRMAYRRAIEDYREAQALQEQLGDFPELLLQQPTHLIRPGL